MYFMYSYNCFKKPLYSNFAYVFKKFESSNRKFWNHCLRTHVEIVLSVRPIGFRNCQKGWFIYTITSNREFCSSDFLQGVSVKSSHLEKHYQSFVIEAKWLCNMSYERKFCGLSEYVRLKKVRLLIKSTDWY